MNRIICWCSGVVLSAMLSTIFATYAFAQNQAQNPTIDALKGKIFDARMAKQMFAGGLKYCGELDGSNFYFAPRDRILNLEEYHRSLENLVQLKAFNPEKRRPWTAEDAALRWEQVQQEALKEKNNCALVVSLPQLEKELDELEKSGKKN